MKFLFILIAILFPFRQETVTSIEVLAEEYKLINEKQWNKIPQLWTKDMSDILGYLNCRRCESERPFGYFNINNVELINYKELPIEIAKPLLPLANQDLSIYQGIKFYYVESKYNVKKESKFVLNGLNYNLVMLVVEDGKWKIKMKVIPPISAIVSQGYGFGTIDEKEFTRRRLQYAN